VYSKSEMDEIYESQKYKGLYIWANKLKNPKILSSSTSTSNCFLLNHWSQRVIHLLEYDPAIGAKGYEVILGTSSMPGAFHLKELECKQELIIWSPFTLEMEISELKWQPIEVSPNIASGELFQYLPTSMKSSPWEILFLLLLSPDLSTSTFTTTSTTSPPAATSSSSNIDNEIYQALFDTGLSPKQGLFAYMRLLEQVSKRAEVWENIPSYRKVFESDITF
jgi:hypothetical protein